MSSSCHAIRPSLVLWAFGGAISHGSSARRLEPEGQHESKRLRGGSCSPGCGARFEGSPSIALLASASGSLMPSDFAQYVYWRTTPLLRRPCRSVACLLYPHTRRSRSLHGYFVLKITKRRIDTIRGPGGNRHMRGSPHETRLSPHRSLLLPRGPCDVLLDHPCRLRGAIVETFEGLDRGPGCRSEPLREHLGTGITGPYTFSSGHPHGARRRTLEP